MKKTIRFLLLTLAAILLLCSLIACKDEKKTEAPADDVANGQTVGVEKTGNWANAAYLSDTSFGTGAKTIAVEVKAEERSVTFTLHTDKETVGDALSEHGLIEGDEGPYGLYVKKVNGITADYDADGYYWSFSQGGTMLMTGVDTTAITDGAHYELVRTK